LIEKDGKPSWSPASLKKISDETIDSIFAAEGAPSFSPTNPFV